MTLTVKPITPEEACEDLSLTDEIVRDINRQLTGVWSKLDKDIGRAIEADAYSRDIINEIVRVYGQHWNVHYSSSSQLDKAYLRFTPKKLEDPYGR